jgi:polyferredoxin
MEIMKWILKIIGLCLLFVIGEVVGGLITAHFVRKYGCPLAAAYKEKEESVKRI